MQDVSLSCSVFLCDSSLKEGARHTYLLLGVLKLSVVRGGYFTCSENSINVRFIQSVPATDFISKPPCE